MNGSDKGTRAIIYHDHLDFSLVIFINQQAVSVVTTAC